MAMTETKGAVVVRQATIHDLETIVEYNAQMALETENLHLDRHRLTEGVRAVFLNPSHGTYFVAEIDGRVVGQLLVTYEWSDWRNGVFWWIQSVYVDPQYRRKGVFTTLYRFVESRAKNDSTVCGLRLYVEHNNTRAQSTYKALGMSMTHYKVMEVDFVLASSRK